MYSFPWFTRSTLWGEIAWVGGIIFRGNFMVRGRGNFPGSNFRRGHCPGAIISEQFPSGPIVLEPLKSNSFFYLALKYNSLL